MMYRAPPPRVFLPYATLFRSLTEDGVVVVEVWGWRHGDEELGTIGARTSVCHSQQVWTVEGELWVELILELVARATTAGAGWVAALDHEVIKDRKSVV